MSFAIRSESPSSPTSPVEPVPLTAPSETAGTPVDFFKGEPPGEPAKRKVPPFLVRPSASRLLALRDAPEARSRGLNCCVAEE